jgi:hypothetical protein
MKSFLFSSFEWCVSHVWEHIFWRAQECVRVSEFARGNGEISHISFFACHGDVVNKSIKMLKVFMNS